MAGTDLGEGEFLRARSSERLRKLPNRAGGMLDIGTTPGLLNAIYSLAGTKSARPLIGTSPGAAGINTGGC